MAHEIQYDEMRGINPIAYTGDTPWHGLGQKMKEGDNLEGWAKAAGMDFTILQSEVHYSIEGVGRTKFKYPGYKALYRDDNKAPLGMVGSRYNIVQPIDVLDFFNGLIEAGGFKMSTAGVLFGGTKFWALAEIGKNLIIKGDVIKGYLLLATSTDLSMGSIGKFTTVRTVCNNTLDMAINENGNRRRHVKIPHSRVFNPEEMKVELGLSNKAFDEFESIAIPLTGRRVKDREALEWLVRLFAEVGPEDELKPEQLNITKAKNVKLCLQLYKDGPGSNLATANGTAWGLVNAVTAWADHFRTAKSIDSRLNNAWFGDINRIKNNALDRAINLLK